MIGFIAPAMQAATGAATAVGEYKRMKGLEKDLAKLMEEQYPEYQLDPTLTKSYEGAQKLQDEYSQRVKEYQAAEKFGLTPEQRSMMQQGAAQQQLINRTNAIRAGGGQMAGFMGALDTNATLNMSLKMAAEDARLQLEKKAMTDAIMAQRSSQYGQVMKGAGDIQSQKNVITQGQQMRRQYLEQALGRAISDTRSRMYQGLGMTQQGISGAENAGLDILGMFMPTNFGGGGGGYGGGGNSASGANSPILASGPI